MSAMDMRRNSTWGGCLAIKTALSSGKEGCTLAAGPRERAELNAAKGPWRATVSTGQTCIEASTGESNPDLASARLGLRPPSHATEGLDLPQRDLTAPPIPSPARLPGTPR